MITMTQLGVMLAIGLAWTATTALADRALFFGDGDDSVMPGIRRTSSPGGRARTPSSLYDSAIIFPGTSEGGGDFEWHPAETTETSHIPEPDFLEVPDDLDELDLNSLNRLNSITRISDFAQLFNVTLPQKDSTFDGFNLSVRFGGSTDEGETLPMANCKPELVTVPLNLTEELNTMFFPTCIRLEQCGGCCSGSLLTCRPTVTKVVKVKVLKVNTARSSRRRGSSSGRRRRRESTATYHIVDAVKHTACKCDCKKREEDCNSNLHTYYQGECACICKNKDEKTKCESQNSTKYWDNNTCSCYCRKQSDCGSGEYFSQTSCSCERLAARSGLVSSASEGIEA